VTALINNASIFEYDDWQSATRESWDRHMEINLRAPFVLSQAFARQLGKDGHGAIVNIIDQRVLKPTPQFMSYSLSRTGLYWLTQTMAQALAPQVRVNAVAPGPSFIGARQSREEFEKQRASTILGRGAEEADLVAAVRYLLSAQTVTGETIVVDGGQHLAWRTQDVLVQE
jgi:NAD(P)-dependent dehydrogenase (short-subunit alcohol dehydrogenase family)